LDFQHNDLPFPAYQEKKSSEKNLAWHNGLPVMTVNGTAYTQSLAQLRYVGKKAKLYPTDDIAALAVDEVMDIVQDILTKCPQDKDEESKKTKRQEYASGKMKSLFELLNQRAEETGSGWICSGEMTIAGTSFLAVHIFVLSSPRYISAVTLMKSDNYSSLNLCFNLPFIHHPAPSAPPCHPSPHRSVCLLPVNNDEERVV